MGDIKSSGRGLVQVTPRALVKMDLASRGLALGRFHFVAKLPDGQVLTWDAGNILVSAGLIYFSGAALRGVTPITAWYIFLMQGTPTVAPGDTMASHAGWTEFTNYTEGARQTWTGVAQATAGHVSNTAAPAIFTMDAGSNTVGGAGMASVSTKGAGTGTFWGGAAFPSGNVVLPGGSTLTVTYLTGTVDDGV